MATTIAQVRAGLVNAIKATATDVNGRPLHASERVSEQVNGPQAWVKIPAGSYEQTMGSLDRKRMRAEVEMLVPVAGGADNAQLIMDHFLSNTGGGSIHAAIAADRYLGGVAKYAMVPGFHDYDPDQVTTINAQQFLTATIDVVVDVQ